MNKNCTKWVALCSIVIVAALLSLFLWLSRTQMETSLYNEATVLENVDFDIKIDTGYNQIIYVLHNRSSQDITYPPIYAIEYYDGHNWQEVLSRTGLRASEGAMVDIAHLLPSETSNGSGYNFGVKHLDDLSHMPDGQYRLVIPVSDDSSTVIASDPFEWVA